MVTGGRVHCDALGTPVCIPDRPERIVSLVAGLTEAIHAIGCGDRLSGVSAYCHRYVPDLKAPVVGDYLTVDDERLAEIKPDLVLLTTGVQRALARKLSSAGYPAYVLPLPSSIHGVLENVMLLGGLLGEVDAARALAHDWLSSLRSVRAVAGSRSRAVFAELWFGRHVRVPGGLSFINDMIEFAGGRNVFGGDAAAYMRLDVDGVAVRHPEIWLLFSEPEYPVDGTALMLERGWDRAMPGLRLIEAGVEPDRNMIHDGPSMVRAVRWLAERIAECA